MFAPSGFLNEILDAFVIFSMRATFSTNIILPEDRRVEFLRNVDSHLHEHTALQSRRPPSTPHRLENPILRF
jgi:hypothetical protein